MRQSEISSEISKRDPTMVRSNPERQKKIEILWRQGLTVEKIARATGIPRSSVGHYVRKLNLDMRRGRTSRSDRKESNVATATVLGPSTHHESREKTDPASDLVYNFLKVVSFSKLMGVASELFNAGRYDQLYYLYKSTLLFQDITEMYRLSPEQAKELNKAFYAFMKADLAARLSSNMLAGTPSPTMTTPSSPPRASEQPKRYTVSIEIPKELYELFNQPTEMEKLLGELHFGVQPKKD